ncbi:hypothetical protein [Rhodanobacter lindaniclasticus]
MATGADGIGTDGAGEHLASDPAHAGAATLLGKLLQGHGLLNAACEVMAALCRSEGLTAATTFRCAQFIQQCQRQPLAAALCDEAFARGSDSAELRVLAGQVARELGKFDVARAHYLWRWPPVSISTAGTCLAHWRRASATHHAITRNFGRLAAHFRDTGYSARSRATSGLGLAKACDDIGDYALAAAALREANRLLQQASPWSSQAWTHWLNARLRSLPLRAALPADPDFVPIFIVGMPRSGTTLAASRAGQAQGRA